MPVSAVDTCGKLVNKRDSIYLALLKAGTIEAV